MAIRNFAVGASVFAFTLVVVVTNYTTNTLGVVNWLGVTTTAGTWFAGLTFVCRDIVQELGGRKWVVLSILIGATISGIFNPQLAIASSSAFVLSELADYAVYQPIRVKSRIIASLLSNSVGAVIDSLIFLSVAGLPLSLLVGQISVKIGMTTAFVLTAGGTLAVFRESVRAESVKSNG